MDEKYFTPAERDAALPLVAQLLRDTREIILPDDFKKLRRTIADAVNEGHYRRDRQGINPALHNIDTSVTLCKMVSPDRNMIIATLLYKLCDSQYLSIDNVTAEWGDDIARLVNGLLKVSTLYGRQSGVVKTDNFRKLLMTFAEDIRVIIIMIVDRLVLMRAINHHPNEKFVTDTAFEANYLYAPLAHRLGLYKIKGELEDLSLKYTARETYTKIARELNETKVARDAYIAGFIAPL